MNLTHKISLDPTLKQRRYFVCAAGTHRFVFNWALAEWNRQYKSGIKPNANLLKKQFNASYKGLYPWVSEVHRDCHARPFVDLGKSFSNFFSKRSKHPKFKSKHKVRASFYIANDKISLEDFTANFPVIGKVRLREEFRFKGKIMSARVVQDAGDWFLCVSVVGDFSKSRTGNNTVGVDLGIKTLATLSNGEQFENPKPLRKAQARLRRAQRKLARQVKGSNNRFKQRLKLSRIHRRIRNLRNDSLHKLTTRLCRENQTVVIEDLAPANMVKNHCLAQSLSDASFGLFRTLLTYKAGIYGTRIVVADRFFPSSKTCSSCGKLKESLTLGERTYKCSCGLKIDRDLNAARNLRKLGTTCAEETPVDTRRRVVEAGNKPCSYEHTLEGRSTCRKRLCTSTRRSPRTS